LQSSQDEIKRLSGKLTSADCVLSFRIAFHFWKNSGQDERIEEIRDTHRLESKSQSARIESLRRQLTETEDILTATQDSISQTEGDSAKGLAEIEQLKAEIQRVQNLAKEEEEKRVKAISLLKTVRQKLVKAEKEKDEATKEWNMLKEKEASFQEREKAEISRLQQDIHTVHAEREQAVLGLKAQFDKELANLKEKHSKEMSALRMRLEMENSSSEVSHRLRAAPVDHLCVSDAWFRRLMSESFPQKKCESLR
jgi:chromosome segregation ATPase